MKLRFKEQQYQTDATNAVVDCFLGQQKQTKKEIISRGVSEKKIVFEEIAFSNNKIDISDDTILENIKKVQKEKQLPIQKKLAGKDFSIEMETGTGKTYVYTKTMHELNKKYGWSKFIIMVPSIAIREGVNKSLQITEEHFQEIYGKKIRFFIYDNKNKNNISNIKSFATSSEIQVMIMNYQAFTSRSEEGRRIYAKLDEMESRKPIDLIKVTNPILIIDEPQKLGKQAYESIKKFNSLFRLRYSATHKKGEEYNKIYRLDAVDAYNQKLVKKIGVKGIETKDDTGTDSYLFLDKINISKNSYPTAKIEIEVKQKNTIKKVLRNIKEGDDLYDLSNSLSQYKEYIVNKIDGYENTINFINGIKIKVGQVNGTVEEKHIRRIQIREAIKSHLEKESILFKKGIKNLSLFFIDKVEKYRKYNEENKSFLGEYAEIFEEEYKNTINEYRGLFDEDYCKYLDKFKANQVHNGYFSIDKKGKLIDSKVKRGEEGSSDITAYDLIMKNKERLLNFEEPTRFIFSHSALREGWDNPNIFQICTLKQAQSDISRRQEIGRGLRICVNKSGYRMDDSVLENNFFDINKLTVIASESYEDFARNLQKEITDSLSDRPMKISTQLLIGQIFTNKEGEEKMLSDREARRIINHLEQNEYIDENDYICEKTIEEIEKETISLPEEVSDFKDSFIELIKKIYDVAQFKATENERKNNVSNLELNENFYKKEFQELWSKIKLKTAYEVDFNSDELIKKSVNHIDSDLKIKKPKAVITYGEQADDFSVEILKNNEFLGKEKISTEEINLSIKGRIKYDLIAEIAKETNLTRKSVALILKKIKENVFLQYRYNPENFIAQASKIINEQKAATIINCITYHKTEDCYDDIVFTENLEGGVLGKNIIEVKKHIYNYLRFDSDIEKKFAENMEVGEVSVYAKLPSGFKIPTPIGNYNPDWAIVIDKDDCKYVYLIAETKGDLESMNLRGGEKSKIEYAKKHFASLNENKIKYTVVNNYENLMEKIMK
jgi:type III restriction enzyme